MIGWIKKLIIKKAIKYVRNQIGDYEMANPELREFHDNLYNMTIANFIRYATATLGKKNKVDTLAITFPDYLKQLIEPMDDRYEKIVIQIIDGLK